MIKGAGECLTCHINLLEQFTLYADRHVLIVAALDLLIKREQHLLTVVTVGVDTAALDRAPLITTECCQTIAGGMAVPAAKGGPLIRALKLANLGALLNDLEPPPLFAVLAKRHLVLVDMERDVLHGSILPCLLTRSWVLLAVGALERLVLPV